MANNKQNIEDLFKDNLKDYSVNPSSSVWNNINRTLIFKKFFKFNPATFNIYYTVLIGILSTVTIYNIPNSGITSGQINPKQEKIVEIRNIKTTNINKTEINTNTIKKERKLSANNNISTKNKTKIAYKKTTHNNDLTTNIVVKNNHTKENANIELEKNNNSKLAKPSADFSASTYSACEPATIVFTNASENCDKFLWNFGNEASSEKANPTFVFKTTGKYTVKLTVYSGSISTTISKEISILSKPKSEFIVSDKNDIFMNDEVKFANLSTNFNSCKWNFGDENTSNFTHPSHIFEEAGLYDVSLICFSENNCSDTAIVKNIQIKEDKYKIYAATALNPDINGQSSGYLQNGESSNSVFRPIFNTEPSEYYLRIFNKFGSFVFESRDINLGWNGYYNNKPAPFDVYIWECTGKYADGKVFIKTGNLTLLYLRNQ